MELSLAGVPWQPNLRWSYPQSCPEGLRSGYDPYRMAYDTQHYQIYPRRKEHGHLLGMFLCSIRIISRLTLRTTQATAR